MSEAQGKSGAGARLAAARQARGLSLATLAAQLKVPEARLAALEGERWAELPDGPYARGLATSVCRALGMETRELLQLMPGAAPVALDKVAEGINRPVQLHPRQRLMVSGPMLLLLLVLLAIAAAVAFWPQGRELPWSWGDPTAEVESEGETVRLVEAPAAASVPAPQAPQTVMPPPAAPVQAAPVLPQANVQAPALAQFSLLAKEDTWVSVADAAGASLVARVLPAGERLQLDAPRAPLRVVLGNAPGAELSWRGQAQDLTAYQGVRVARLTLN